MTRDDLVKTIQKLGLQRKRAQLAVDGFFGAITRSLRDGEKVSIVGFGTWEWRLRSARQARNPKTGKVVPLGKRRTLVFKPSSRFKKRLRSS